MESTGYWLAVGKSDNWDTATMQGIWGLKSSQRRLWNSLRTPEDIVFFYVTSPVAGVVGSGHIVEKMEDNLTPIWPDEHLQGKVIWPLRFRFSVRSMINRQNWETSALGYSAMKRRARAGFQPLDPSLANEVLDALKPFARNR